MKLSLKVVQGRHQAILFSVIIHVILLLVLYATVSPPHIKQAPNKSAIKSYIYQPKKVIEKQSEPLPARDEIVPQDIEPQINPIEKKILEDAREPKIDVTEQKPIATEKKNEQNLPNEVTVKPDPFQQPTPVQTSSPYGNLNKLRDSINQNIIANEMYQQQQTRSPSVMHGDEIPVPHSTIQKSEIQKREEATTSYGEGVDVIKGDDGLCFVERDLGAVGIEGVKSSQAFACGESKFDRSFREHMKKVREKLGQK